MPLAPCYMYIDGGYLRGGLKALGLPEECDPRGAAQFVSMQQFREHAPGVTAVTRFFYYDAIDENPRTPVQQTEASQRQAYWDRLRRLPDTHVSTGRLRRLTRGPRVQKGVDVQLAVDALEAAFSRHCQAIALLAGDADFAPLAVAVRRAGPHVFVLAFRTSLSPQLETAADRVIMLPEQPGAFPALQP